MKLGKKKGLLFALIGCGVLTLGFGALIYFAHMSMDEETKKLEELHGERTALQGKVQQIPNLEKKVIILREVVQEYLDILPNSKEVDDFVRMIYGFQDETGVQITELNDKNSKSNAKDKNKEPGFGKVSYQLKLAANLWEFLGFLHQLESHKRFVRVAKMKVAAGERKKGEDALKTKHEFELDIETYLFDPSGAAKPADIKNYAKRVEGLQDEIAREKDRIIAEPYDYHGARGRRDPFVDPRLPVVSGEGGEEMLRKQLAIVDELRADLAKIGQMVLEHGQANQMIRRFELRRDIEQSISALSEKIARVEKEGKVTYLPLSRRMQKDVVEGLAELRLRFDPKSGSDSGPTREELVESAKRIQEHLAEGEFQPALDHYNLIVDRIKAYELDAPRAEVVAVLRQLQREALVAQEFSKKKLSITGVIVSEKEASVALINGRAFGEGEYVDDDLVIRKISSDAIEFIYREVVILKKI